MHTIVMRIEYMTAKQESYVLYLLKRSGFDVTRMSDEYTKLGATPDDLRGSIKNWIRGKGPREGSDLIDALKNMQ